MLERSNEFTERRLLKIEKELQRIYRRAYGDISDKWEKYMYTVAKSAEKRLRAYEKAIAKYGPRSPEAEDARGAYVNYLKQATIVNDRYKDMQAETARKITEANQIATEYINGQTPEIYAVNYNDLAREAGQMLGYTFTEVNEQTIKNLAMNSKKSLLPKSRIDIPKDLVWNKQKMSAEVLQGILQGESAIKIAKRLTKVVNMNRSSALRNARTMVTRAQNKGRLDQMNEQAKLGIKVQKEWLATQDKRTRDSHARLDGERVDINKRFSNGLMEPGDPDGRPEEVYNCRCTLVYFYPDYEDEADRDKNAARAIASANSKSTSLDILNKIEYYASTRLNPAVDMPEKFKKYVPDRKTRKEIIEIGIKAEKPIFDNGRLGKAAKNLLKPEKGYYDIVLHGSENFLDFFGKPIDVETLSIIIANREDYTEGMPIRLISCNTGKGEGSIGDFLAKKLRTIVKAPENKATIMSDGSVLSIIDPETGEVPKKRQISKYNIFDGRKLK